MVVTYQTVFREISALLKTITQNYLQEATFICCHLLKVDKISLLTQNVSVDSGDYADLISMAKKRCEGYPLQYLLGEWEFYGRRFFVGEGVLIPRADTETLIEAVLENVAGADAINIVDLCSGSGCIAITLGCELKNSRVYAIEKSEPALEFLKRNIELNNSMVKYICGDVLNFDDSLPPIDVLVSNPPYLTSADMEVLQKEVSFEPQMALYGEDDGLYFYHEITKLWSGRIKSGGLIAYEIGCGQEKDVAAILSEYGYKNICQKADLCGIIRVVYGTKF